jgi:predicted RND superfamily exporter protein
MRREKTTFVVRRRRWVRGALVVIAVLFALAIPRLEVHFAPEELVAPDDDAARASAMMEETFGRDEQVVLVLVESDDVLSDAVLDWSHATALRLAGLEGIERVESIGTTPLPRAERDEELSLDALEHAELVEGGADAEERYVAEIVESDPERFPDGLATLAERGRGRISIARLVADEQPTAEERAAIRAIVEESTLIRGRLVSASRRVLAIAAVLEEHVDEEVSTAAVESAITYLRDHPPPGGSAAHVAGLPAMRVTMVRALRQDQLLLVSLAALGSVLVLALGLRSVAGVVVPMSTVGITLAISVGGMALTGQPINLLTNVIPPLLVTIGLAEAVHMVLRYREELPGADHERLVAASRMVRAMWLPCFVTTFTTAIGFGALVLQETAILRRFGVIAAIATMIGYVVTVLFVPASLPSFRDEGRAGDPGHGRRASRVARGLDRMIVAIARTTARSPRATIGVSAVLLLGSIFVARDVVVDSTLLDQFARGSEMVRVTHLLEAELDGVRGLSIGVESRAPGRFFTPEGIAELEMLAAWLREQPGVLRATTHAEWLREALFLLAGDPSVRSERFRNEAQVRALRALIGSGPRDPLTRYVSADGARARIEVRLADRGASRILAMLERLEVRGAELEGLTLRFSGEAWDASRGLDRIVRSLGSLASAVVVIFVVMTLLFRSVRLGLLSIPPNALPLAMTLAYMAIRGIPLHAATVIVFTVTVGLAVDGATHVIARFREELDKGGPIAVTLLRTMETSGRGVVLSSVTLLLGYGALLFSAFEPVRLFGELSAVAIAASLIAQLVLLPALLAAFVRR